MNFQLFFLKEGSRYYEKADLITLLSSNSNITSPDLKDSFGKRVYRYHHTVLDFSADFIMTEKSVVPHLERLDPKYYDVDFYLEFDVLLSSYGVEILLDIVQEICQQFDFKVYCESFQYDVRNFKRTEVMKNFNYWKRAYADKHPEEIAKYNKLDSQTISYVYGYLQKKKRFELTYDPTKIQVSDYIFLAAEKSRSAFVAIRWNGERQFILPPVVDILILDDSKVKRFIPMSEVMMKAEKFFTPIETNVSKLDTKYVNKLHKILTKERFAPLNTELKNITLDKILDI